MKKNSIKLFLKIVMISVFVGTILYVPYLGEKEFQGEEGRRVLVSLQMLETKEFLLPKIFDEPYFYKPPLFNWILAGFLYLVKNYSEFTIRLISVFSLTLTSIFLSLFWYRFILSFKKNYILDLNVTLIILPSLIFLTLPEVIDKAQRAEIDAFYTFIITVSVYSWFYLHEIKNLKTLSYLISGFLTGLGVLTKTLQAFLFFYISVIPYLFFNKKIKELFSINHILYLFSSFSVFLFWLILIFDEVDVRKFILAWIQEYFSAATAQEMTFFQHLKSFTIDAILGYAPWILVLFAYKSKEIKAFIDKNLYFKNLFLFSLFLFLFSYIFHLAFPGARLRYILPSISGLVFLVSVPIYFWITQKKYPQCLNFFTFRFIPLFNLFIGLFFWLYVILFDISLNFDFYLYFVIFLIFNLWLFRLKNHSLCKIIWSLVFLVLIYNFLYKSFYYPFHQKEKNYFRNASFEIANLLDKKALYLCRAIPHHLVYYLKYRYKLITEIYYLKDLKSCLMFERNGGMLITQKDFKELEDLIRKKEVKIYPIKIRTKEYVLIK